MNEYKKIPVNLITGFLGVGKTTAVINLLKNKPENEKWAVLVNEFGEVSIDHAMMLSVEAGQLSVMEVEGGCICCSAQQNMFSTLQTILKQVKPQRILIEPTGLGHPASILDMLRAKPFADQLEVHATICMVNPVQLFQEKYKTNGTYLDQITLADVLVANKTDLASEEEMEHFWEFTDELYPPKIIVDRIEHAFLKAEWLNIIPGESRIALFPDSHVMQEQMPAKTFLKRFPKPGKPLMKPGYSLGNYSCGWIFSAEEIFDLGELNKLIMRLFFENKVHRAKGIFRISSDWYLYNFADGLPSTHYIAYRRDSRLELIADEAQNWAEIQEKIQRCISKNEE
ncbi:GTPase, G3E family [Pseudarcicella hirudinis]|uniref:GTPase, G3E family n=1 Tax=Pseudarcicella hirudinis TaxID=1079859 RepID=A0A1I5X4G6_9BACT|nr:GTP-binding protein [Pseudarcicella hirudinis]SFQ26716.1 GTPase, G3E family [Pseudarcicella hirudinis]